MGVLALVILPLMFWVAPVRPRAVLVIWTTAMAVAVALLFAAYFFEPALFGQGMLHARWVDFESAAFGMSVSYRNAVQTIFVSSPALMLVLPVALITYLMEADTLFRQYSAAPIAALLAHLGPGAPHFPGQGSSGHARVPLSSSLAGCSADCWSPNEGSSPLAYWSVGGLRHREPAAVVAPLLNPVETRLPASPGGRGRPRAPESRFMNSVLTT